MKSPPLTALKFPVPAGPLCATSNVKFQVLVSTLQLNWQNRMDQYLKKVINRHRCSLPVHGKCFRASLANPKPQFWHCRHKPLARPGDFEPECDHTIFQSNHHFSYTKSSSSQVEQGINDNLARPVVSPLAPAIRFHYWYVSRIMYVGYPTCLP